METSKSYHGKIMLFGEYSIMLGSPALTIPLRQFSGRWQSVAMQDQTDEKAATSHAALLSFWHYLSGNETLSQKLDLDQFKTDLDNGLYFSSDIPLAYGAGSSGALVAAVYDSYAKQPTSKLTELRILLASMESMFHGQSSGIDPLSCLIGKPLLINNEQTETVENPLKMFDGQGRVFLLDTQTTGETGPLVERFKQMLCTYSFYKQIRDTMLPETVRCINTLLSNDLDSFFDALRQLSAFQLKFMQPMIPESFHALWQQGLKTGDYNLKLCGSGGGGFLLGFSKNKNLVLEGFQERVLFLV